MHREGSEGCLLCHTCLGYSSLLYLHITNDRSSSHPLPFLARMKIKLRSCIFETQHVKVCVWEKLFASCSWRFLGVDDKCQAQGQKIRGKNVGKCREQGSSQDSESGISVSPKVTGRGREAVLWPGERLPSHPTACPVFLFSLDRRR